MFVVVFDGGGGWGVGMFFVLDGFWGCSWGGGGVVV